MALAAGYWSKGINISQPEGVVQALSGIFSEGEIKSIMQGAVSPENKRLVMERTRQSEAFGAPWIVALDSEGRKKMWFGNDRWDQVFYHLGVPFKGVEVLGPKESRL